MAEPEVELLCPFCNGALEEDMYDGTYGCDTGCDYVRFSLECPHCKKEVYRTGAFGSAFEDWDDVTAEEYRAEFLDEWAAAVQKINAERNAAESKWARETASTSGYGYDDG